MPTEPVNPTPKDAAGAPRGELMIRTLAMPADTNQNGDIFGGWVLGQMDIAGGVACFERAKGRVATVAVESMTFHQPVRVGDVLCCYVEIVRVGRSSMTTEIEAWVLRRGEGTRMRVTQGRFTYVAIDDKGRPRPVPPAMPANG
ncbi:MAG: acyl-CoA thioesterase [Alphaproteobacteria bacterium]|nr:acyl-CoA thioesterase [Alphaproteobacteria bacterium]